MRERSFPREAAALGAPFGPEEQQARRRRAPHSEVAAPARPSHPESDVRVGPLMPLAGLLRELGSDPATVFAAGGLGADAFDDCERRVPFRAAAAVLARAAQAARRDDIGVLLGRRFEIEYFGLLGSVMYSARSVGDALRDLGRYFHLQDRGAAVYLSSRGAGTVALGYSQLDADASGVAAIYDLAMMIGVRLLRALAGPAFRPSEVSLMRPAPARPADYRRAYGAPVVFDAARSEIAFAARWLDAAVAGSDGSAYAHAQRSARSAAGAVAPGLAVRAQAAAQALLAGGAVSAQTLAGAFGVHERTLRRQLSSEGSSIAAVVATARFELARQLLRETALPLSAIGAALGYAGAPAFVRAFRGWAGCTPGAWRAQRADVAPRRRG